MGSGGGARRGPMLICTALRSNPKLAYLPCVWYWRHVGIRMNMTNYVATHNRLTSAKELSPEVCRERISEWSWYEFIK